MSGEERSGPEPRRLYGRRRGHRLRQGRQELIEALLPKVRVVLPKAGPLDLEALFGRPADPLWLEIGFGAGEHLAFQAAAHPEIAMIGCEPFINGVAGLLSRIAAAGLANIRIFDEDGRLLLERLPEACLDRVFILFADPWPKKRHHKRRLIGPATLGALARALKDGAEVRFASDDAGYVRWSLEHLTGHPAFVWTARRPGDWHERPADACETRYEAKARARGRSPVYLRFRRRERAAGLAAGPDRQQSESRPIRPLFAS